MNWSTAITNPLKKTEASRTSRDSWTTCRSESDSTAMRSPTPSEASNSSRIEVEVADRDGLAEPVAHLVQQDGGSFVGHGPPGRRSCGPPRRARPRWARASSLRSRCRRCGRPVMALAAWCRCAAAGARLHARSSPWAGGPRPRRATRDRGPPVHRPRPGPPAPPRRRRVQADARVHRRHRHPVGRDPAGLGRIHEPSLGQPGDDLGLDAAVEPEQDPDPKLTDR